MYLWIIAAFTAYFIKGLCGFANTLVFTSILSFGAANANISPVELLIGYPTNFILTWKNRKSLDYKVYLPLAALVLAGCIPGGFASEKCRCKQYQGDIWQCGSALWAGNAFSGQEKGRGNPLSQSSPRSRLTFGAVGLLAGVLCGLFGVGALLAVYVDRVTDSGSEFKANISAVFIADNTFRIILYSALHLLTFDTLKSALMLIPIAILGLFAGMKSSSLLKEKTVRRMMAVLLILSGVSLTLQNM